VLDSDVILVMDDGFAAEFDTPAALLAKPGSLFSELVNNWREETE
jgi:ABC-type multidrug transport system fused ATPase/permease subunit